MDIKFFIFDVETTINNHPILRPSIYTGPIGEKKGWGDYFVPDNHVVMWGMQNFPSEGGTRSSNFIYTFDSVLQVILNTKSYVALVGINLGFDLSYFIPAYFSFLHDYYSDDTRKALVVFQQSLDRLLAWDLQLIEYLVTGHDTKFASMKELAEKYYVSREDKDTILNEYWSKGINTTDIPLEDLEEYLLQDLETTVGIFKPQYYAIQEAIKGNPNFLNLLIDNLKGRVATVCMQLQPFSLKLNELKKAQEEFDKKLYELEEQIEDITWDLIVNHGLAPSGTDRGILEFNSIPSMVRFALGEELTLSSRTVTMEDGKVKRYKSGAKKGQPVLKRETKEIKLPIDSNYLSSRAVKTTTAGTVSLDEDNVDSLTNSIPSTLPDTSRILRAFAAYKKIQKVLSTYIVGMIKNAGCSKGGYTKACNSSTVLPTTYNHCATSTGRLSSSKPNLQNLT